jgi:P4 family phage/plasmid primase-like protien
MSFLKKQFDYYDKHGITYVSRNMNISYDEERNKIKKEFDTPTKAEIEKGFETYRDEKLNSCMVPTGEDYKLIVVDVDVCGKNKDTLTLFNKFVEENNINMDTFTMKTINNGFHYYFKPSKEQRLKLKDFTKSIGKFLGSLDIDIFYNQSFVYGATICNIDEKIYKYRCCNDIKIATLPDELFREILKRISGKSNKIKEVSQSNNEDETNNIEHEEDKRLKLYLDALTKVNDRNDWLTIGNVIYNEGGSFSCFNNYSKQFEKYYDYDGIVKVWKSYKKGKYQFCNLASLKDIIAKYAPHMLHVIENKDTKALLDRIFEEQINDDVISRLFYSLYPSQFIYAPENDIWYSINKYGIYEVEGKDNITIKQLIKTDIKSLLEQEMRTRKNFYRLTIDEMKKNNDDDKVDEKIKQFAKFQKNCNSIISYIGKAINKKSIILELAIMYSRKKIYEEFDKINPYVFAFSNGVYDLKNKIFRNALPDELVSITTGYEYNTKRNKKNTEKINLILSQIFPDDKERKYILNTLSLCLLGLNILEEFYIWIGTGSNGKGVLSSLLSKMLGGYYDSMDVEYLVKSNTQRTGADPVMARKKGVRGVITTELEKESKLREGKLKELTGRDEIQVRDLYKSSFNYIPVFKIFIQTNKKPEIDGTDLGLKRRLRLIHFPSKFVDNPKAPNEYKIDRSLKDDFQDYDMLLSFFDILLQHYNEIEQDKYYFEFPDRFKHETELFFKDNDPIDAFLNDCTEECKGTNSTLKEIHNAYINYCSDSGFETVKNKTFKETLVQKGYTTKRISEGFVLQNLKLK